MITAPSKGRIAARRCLAWRPGQGAGGARRGLGLAANPHLSPSFSSPALSPLGFAPWHFSFELDESYMQAPGPFVTTRRLARAWGGHQEPQCAIRSPQASKAQVPVSKPSPAKKLTPRVPLSANTSLNQTARRRHIR